MADGDTYVICNPEYALPDLTICDLVDPTWVTGFNGDDGLALFNGTTIVDQIGVEAVDPGTAWDVAGVVNATEEHTLVRKPEIVNGSTDWATAAGTNAADSEWIVKEQNDVSSLGSR